MPLPVGVRLPLVGAAIDREALAAIVRAAVDLGYSSLWVGDHVLLPATSDSVYPHTADGTRPFTAKSGWLDPLLELGWLAAQFPSMDIGTSVMILPLRNPLLLAKQLATLSWLTNQQICFGVGTGWLQDEYDAVGAPFTHRATAARHAIATIRGVLTTGAVSGGAGESGPGMCLSMQPTPAQPPEFLWGGVSPLALRIVASSCDGWLPAKQSFSNLTRQLAHLKQECDQVGRGFDDLRLVVKPGPGINPDEGAINRHNLERYEQMGFAQAILELPLEPSDAGGVLGALDSVANRTWA